MTDDKDKSTRRRHPWPAAAKEDVAWAQSGRRPGPRAILGHARAQAARAVRPTAQSRRCGGSRPPLGRARSQLSSARQRTGGV